jgi:hypothetical protein
MPSTKDLEERRDVLLMLVFLDEWQTYRPWFPLRKVALAMRRFRRLSALVEWVRREGVANAN